MTYDAILVVSFGGPESTDDVIPFLENVLRGKNVPRERMLAVAEHYYHFGGKSPINGQNRQFIAALNAELIQYGPRLPIYWGNRNWHPLLADTLRQMKADGVSRALAFVTSAYSSYSSCRQYRENIAHAQAAAGEGALIIKESVRLHAEGMSGAAFRHGPLEMVNPETFAAVFAGAETTKPLQARLLDDIRKAGGKTGWIAEDASGGAWKLPRTTPPMRPIVEILPAQMMTLALAAEADIEAGRFARVSKITTTE